MATIAKGLLFIWWFHAKGIEAIASLQWQKRIATLNAFFSESDSNPIADNGYPDGTYLPLIGNGYISHAKGVRDDTMFVAGIYNGQTTSPSHRARLPATLSVQIINSIDDGCLLDVEYGTYYRSGHFQEGSSYELRWYAHRSLRSLYILELEVIVGNTASITLDLSTFQNATSVDFVNDPVVNINGPRDTTVLCRTTKIAESEFTSTQKVCVAGDTVPLQVTVSKAESGKVITFVTATRTSLDAADGDVFSAALSDYNNAVKLAEDGDLWSSHVAAWAEIWKSGVEVQGRPDVGIAINSSLFAILSSVRDDWPHGLAPGGMTNYYNGHSFWDTETWMYPPILFLHPAISQSLLMYRFNRLDGARRKALSYSPPFAGTMFPWESAFSGIETCPLFADTGLREDHISGDIAFAVWQEWLTRRDVLWLRQIGYPILVGVADFWVSIADYSTDGTAHIRNVIPPDEYVDHVDDSVYTNFVAAQALRFAVLASKVLGVVCPTCAVYSRLAEDIVILFDEELGIHPEYAGYKGDVVKQADVVLLHYPLGLPMSPEVQRADLDYYSSRTDHNGPAMTWGMHSIGFLDLLDFDQAAMYFNMSFADNMHPPFHIWTETPDGNACNFMTGAGGFLQTVISGYPGIRLSAGVLLLKPVCPEGVSGMTVRSFEYLGNDMTLQFWCGAAGGGAPRTSMYPHKISITVNQRGGGGGAGLAYALTFTGPLGEGAVEQSPRTLSPGDTAVLSLTATAGMVPYSFALTGAADPLPAPAPANSEDAASDPILSSTFLIILFVPLLVLCAAVALGLKRFWSRAKTATKDVYHLMS